MQHFMAFVLPKRKAPQCPNRFWIVWLNILPRKAQSLGILCCFASQSYTRYASKCT